jgi:hypothetical protein
MNRFVSLLLGLALLGGGIYLAKDVLRLQHGGVAAVGTVVDAQGKHEIRVGGDRGVESRSENSAMVEFTPVGGNTVQFKSLTWSRQTIGDQVKVLYNKDNPADARIDSFFAWLAPLALGFLGVVAALYGLGITDAGLETNNRRGWTLFRWFD